MSAGLRVNLVGTFGKSVTVNGAAATSFSNGFTLEPPDPGVDAVVAGNLTVSFGQAAFGNQFNVLTGVGGQTSRVGGTVQLTSTNASSSLPDSFVVEGSVGGSLILRSGQAASEFSFAATAEVGGDLRYTGGNGSNTIGAAAVFGNVFAGSVAGNLSITLGNGTNLVDLQAGVGGKLIFRGGNGSNTLNLAPTTATLYTIDAVFGTGTNVLDLNNGGGTVSLTGRIEGTGGSNTFDSAGAILLPTLVLIRFP